MPPELQDGWAEIFSGNSVPGESGAPFDPRGQVVGVLVAGGKGETAAPPLDRRGVPVVGPGREAAATHVDGYGDGSAPVPSPRIGSVTTVVEILVRAVGLEPTTR